MRCLYCGKQLPLLKKLTGGGEFCSEAHRQKYQEEYNKLALSRLLQTQNPDSDGPGRGELILATRHPALQARPPLRALEAPKSVEPPPPAQSTPNPALTGSFGLPSLKESHTSGTRLEPLPANWTPGTSRPQRALPAPLSLAPAKGPEKAAEPAPDIKYAVSRKAADEQPGDFTQEMKKPPAGGKRDAFSFRPRDPFAQEMMEKAMAPPPPDPPPAAAAPEPVVVSKPAPLPTPPAAVAPPQPLQPVAQKPVPREAPDPPQAAFLVETVPPADPPPFKKPESDASQQPFTDGKPPVTGKPPNEGALRWEPDIQGGPGGGLEPLVQLLSLPAPPGTASGGNGSIPSSEAAVDDDQDRKEIRKKILENRVKPGDFKQTVPKAPEGPATVLPICPPAAALDRIAVSVKAKTPAANPGLHLSVVVNGESLWGNESLWSGWTATGLPAIRVGLTPIAPPTELEVIAKADVKPPQTAAAPPDVAKNKTVAEPLRSDPVRPEPVRNDAPRNYKAAEALKSAAQAVVLENGNAAKPQTQQPVKPSTPRHEVFVDLSVLGIEEDEDADAESRAREGESPPGNRPKVAAREPLRDFVSLTHTPAPPPPLPKPRPMLQEQAQTWPQPGLPPVRLSSEPLRPKVVFTRPQETPPQPPARPATTLKPIVITSRDKVAGAIAIPADPQAMPHRVLAVPPPSSASLAATWSAKRLQKNEAHKNEANVPQQEAPANSRPQPAPVETAVQEPSVTAPAAILATPIPIAAPNELPKEIPAAAIAPPEKAEKAANLSKIQPAKPEPVKVQLEKIQTDPPFEAPLLGAGTANNGGFLANLPILPKLALGLAIVAGTALGAWTFFRPINKPAPADPSARTGQKSPVRAGSNLMMNLSTGWSPDWGGEANRKKNRTISFYRPSADHADYRIEFDARIAAKGLGWVFRAIDPSNYYAYKIEQVKMGSALGTALTRFAVVAGVEGQKHFTPLSKPIRPGASFHVRLDVRDDEFSAYINEELIEVWQDERLTKGGIGLMTEAGENAEIRTVRIFELVP